MSHSSSQASINSKKVSKVSVDSIDNLQFEEIENAVRSLEHIPKTKISHQAMDFLIKHKIITNVPPSIQNLSKSECKTFVNSNKHILNSIFKHEKYKKPKDLKISRSKNSKSFDNINLNKIENLDSLIPKEPVKPMILSNKYSKLSNYKKTIKDKEYSINSKISNSNSLISLNSNLNQDISNSNSQALLNSNLNHDTSLKKINHYTNLQEIYENTQKKISLQTNSNSESNFTTINNSSYTDKLENNNIASKSKIKNDTFTLSVHEPTT